MHSENQPFHGSKPNQKNVFMTVFSSTLALSISNTFQLKFWNLMIWTTWTMHLQKRYWFSNNFQTKFSILVHCAQPSTAAAWRWRLSSRRGERACLLFDAKYMEMSHCQGNWLPNMDKVNFFCMCVPLRYLARPTYQEQAALKWFGLQSFQSLKEMLDILHD